MPNWIKTTDEPPEPKMFPIILESTGLPKVNIYPKPLDWL